MKYRRLILAAAMVLCGLAACDKNPYGPTGYQPDNGGKEEEEEKEDTTEVVVPATFAKGADISWVTQMEEDGVEFYNATGKETECTELMKELGFNSIRLRVWVDPEDGWCNSEDVLEKAFRAYNLGMRLLIDFHYSDTWADPSNQTPPAAWKSFTAGEMAEAVKKHTTDVLKSMKEVGIDVEWVQVGNEINSGMLHPLGDITQPANIPNFVKFVNAGYDAVKAVYPEAKVILHRSNGQETDKFAWFLNVLKVQKVKYDIIGMSLYPIWWENGSNGWNAGWKSVISNCLDNVRNFSSTYGKPVMICEIGVPVSEPQMSKEAVKMILDGTREIESCHGVFYWEPQTDGVWKPSSYAALGWNAYDKGAFKDGKATIILDPFK